MTQEPIALTSIIGPWKPVHYGLSLDIDHTKKNFVGEANVRFKPNPSIKNADPESPLQITLNSEGLVIVQAVLVQGDDEKAVVTYDRPNQRVVLTFANVKSSHFGGEKVIDVSIKYIGKVNRINTYKDKTTGLFMTNYLDTTTGKASNNILATQSQTCDARRIFPCVDELACTASIQLTLKISSRFTAVSSAPVLDEQVQDDKVVIKFAETLPMVISLFSFVCGDMEFLEDAVTFDNGSVVPLRVFTLKGNLSKARYSLSVAKHFLPLVSAKLGAAYPLEKLDMVGLPFLSNGAVENWSLVTVQQDILLVDAEDVPVYKNKVRQLTQIIVHELVHQWFGNWVGFDSWQHYWMNEALATFLAYAVLNEHSFGKAIPHENTDFQTIWTEQATLLESVFESDASADSVSISDISESVANINVGSIDQTFNQLSYEKGIHLLRMFLNAFTGGVFDDSSDRFFGALGKLVEKHQFKSIKPVDYWLLFEGLKDSSVKYNLINVFVSWIKLPGFPIVDVSLTENGEIRLEQHRFVREEDKHNEYEDYVYQVPLAATLTDGSVLNLLLDQRTKVFTKEELDPAAFLKLNANRTGYYKVKYNNLQFFTNICENISTLSELDLLAVLLDIESFIGSQYQSSSDVEGLLKLAKALVNVKAKGTCYSALEVVLRVLQFLGTSVQLFQSEKEYSHFKAGVLKPLVSGLSKKLEWPASYAKTDYAKAEVNVRSVIIVLGVEDEEIVGHAKALFKSLNHGPQKSVPRELVGAVLVNYVYNANIKGYKKVLQLSTRSAAVVVPNIRNALEPEAPVAATEVQSAAVTALGFARDEALLQKTLNYIATNVDSRGIELGLVGFNYFRSNAGCESNPYKRLVWRWFTLHWDQWGARSLREGSEYSQQLFTTVHNLFATIAKSFTAPADVEALEAFVAANSKQYAQHRLRELYEQTVAAQQKHRTASTAVDAAVDSAGLTI